MKIANPIYDVVFKFMMEDSQSAKIFLSEVTGLDIVTLEYLPQEVVGKKRRQVKKSVPQDIDLSVFRLDFSARIRDADGREKIIIIELQKSNVNPRIMRFRKYVGKQYTNEQLFQWVTPRVGRRYKKGVPILPIFILGGAMAEFRDIPVLDINCQIVDRYAGKVLESSYHFIESLFHNGIIINLMALYKKRRNDLEKLLSIFDCQGVPKNKHIMNVKETDFADRFQPILRRLQAAIAEAEVQNKMDQEDDVLADLYDQQYVIEMAKLDREEGIRMQENGLRMQEEGKLMQEEARRIEEEARSMKEEAQRDQEKAIRLLLEVGLSAEQISAKLALPIEKILSLRKS